MTTISASSLIMPGMTASLHPFGLNPLAEDFQSVSPALYVQAVQRNGRPPKMFTGGVLNLPVYTASGIDPHWLLELPFTARHYAADLATEDEVTALILHCTDPTARYDHGGFDEAVARVRAWASGRPQNNTKTVTPAARHQRPTSSRRQHQRMSQGVAHIMAMSKRGEFLSKAHPAALAPRPASGPQRKPRSTREVNGSFDGDSVYLSIWPNGEGN